MSTETQEPEVQNEETSQTEGYAEVIRNAGPVATGPTAEEHHAAKLTAMREHLTDLDIELDALDNRRKEVRSQRESAISRLNAATFAGPEYHPLLDGQAAKPEEPEAWRALPVDALCLTGGIQTKLESAALSTLGQLSDAMNGERWWSGIEGIGEGKAETIAEAFAEFWAKHPEYCEKEDEALATLNFDAEPEEDAE